MAVALTFGEAASLLREGAPLESIRASNGNLQTSGRLWRIKARISPCARLSNQEEIYKLTLDRLRYGCDDSVIEFSRQLTRLPSYSSRLSHLAGRIERFLVANQSPFSQGYGYELSCNSKGFDRWCGQHHDPNIFVGHPVYTDLLQKTHLDSTIAKLGDQLIWTDGEPSICVEGRQMGSDEFLHRFEARRFEDLHETLIVERATGEVWSYLGTGMGLQPYHPYHFSFLRPFSRVSSAEHATLLESARAFVRPGEDPMMNWNRPYIMQLVSSYTEQEDDVLNMNAGINAVFRRAKHPWLRLITPSGDVYCVGYNWEEPIRIRIAKNSHGRLRSPDRWEFQSCTERVVTNIALSKGESCEFFAAVDEYQKAIQRSDSSSPTFNLIRQNCSVFVRAMLLRIIGVEIDTEATILQTVGAMRPLIPSGLNLENKNQLNDDPIRHLPPVDLPPIFHALDWGAALADGTCWFLRGVRNVWLNTIFLTLFGGFRGPEGTRFLPTDGSHGEDPEKINPLILGIRRLFYQQTTAVHLPAKVQMWQRMQGRATLTIPHPKGVQLAPTVGWEEVEGAE